MASIKKEKSMDQSIPTHDSHREENIGQTGSASAEAKQVGGESFPVHEKSVLEEFGPRGEEPLSLPIDFTNALNEIEGIEGKLECTLQFMQNSLERGGGQHFKEFWEGRKLCIAFFKETMNATRRVQLWATYSELCREARRLKELFDEQSAFLTEQMEMAIRGLSEEVNHLAGSSREESLFLRELEDLLPLKEHKEEYQRIQKELACLNAFAQRTTALRKELVHADMKLRNKNKLFQKLSVLGDSIFPKRKELIQAISSLYLSDVERFIQSTFVRELSTVELFQTRDQIKALQQIAKLLTLSTEVFNKTRLELSECWDSIKEVVKERKKNQADVRQEKRQQKEEVLQQLEELKKRYEEKNIDPNEAERQLKHLSGFLRTLSFHPLDGKFLREKIQELEERIRSEREKEHSSRKVRLKEKEEERTKKFGDVFSHLEYLSSHPQEAVVSAVQNLEKEIEALSLSKKERYEFEQLLARLKNCRASFDREQLISSSTPDQVQLFKKKELLLQQKNELRVHLDRLRKERGGSGSDFSHAFQLDDMIQEEKQRLKSIEDELHDLENQ